MQWREDIVAHSVRDCGISFAVGPLDSGKQCCRRSESVNHFPHALFGQLDSFFITVGIVRTIATSVCTSFR